MEDYAGKADVMGLATANESERNGCTRVGRLAGLRRRRNSGCATGGGNRHGALERNRGCDAAVRGFRAAKEAGTDQICYGSSKEGADHDCYWKGITTAKQAGSRLQDEDEDEDDERGTPMGILDLALLMRSW